MNWSLENMPFSALWKNQCWIRHRIRCITKFFTEFGAEQCTFSFTGGYSAHTFYVYVHVCLFTSGEEAQKTTWQRRPSASNVSTTWRPFVQAPFSRSWCLVGHPTNHPNLVICSESVCVWANNQMVGNIILTQKHINIGWPNFEATLVIGTDILINHYW